jgi:hypothetical protein
MRGSTICICSNSSIIAGKERSWPRAPVERSPAQDSSTQAHHVPVALERVVTAVQLSQRILIIGISARQ